MKKILTLCILVLILTILDNSFMPFLAVYGNYSSLLFIFTLSYSLINDRWSALGIGIITGILQDIFFPGVFGINILTNMLLCVLAGEIGRSLFKEKRFMPVIAITGLILFKGILVSIILDILHIETSIYSPIIIAVYSFFITVFAYKFIYNLCKKEYMIRRWKF